MKKDRIRKEISIETRSILAYINFVYSGSKLQARTFNLQIKELNILNLELDVSAKIKYHSFTDEIMLLHKNLYIVLYSYFEYCIDSIILVNLNDNDKNKLLDELVKYKNKKFVDNYKELFETSIYDNTMLKGIQCSMVNIEVSNLKDKNIQSNICRLFGTYTADTRVVNTLLKNLSNNSNVKMDRQSKSILNNIITNRHKMAHLGDISAESNDPLSLRDWKEKLFKLKNLLIFITNNIFDDITP